MAAECDASLRRLGVDHIDLYQLHWPAPQPIAETAAACGALLEGREDSRDRRVELLGGAARRVDRDRCAAAQRSAAVQHPAPGGEARRPALVRRAQRRRHLLLAAVPRPAVRHVVEGQDLPRGRRPRARTRITRARASSGICRRSTRFARSPPAAASASRNSASASCSRPPASPASSSAPAARDRAADRRPRRQHCCRSGRRGVGDRRSAREGSRDAGSWNNLKGGKEIKRLRIWIQSPPDLCSRLRLLGAQQRQRAAAPPAASLAARLHHRRPTLHGPAAVETTTVDHGLHGQHGFRPSSGHAG